MDTPTVSTHAPGVLLSRLSVFRLRDAARRRDAALQEVHDTYQREVAAILTQDRPATEALRQRGRANLHPWFHTYRYTFPPERKSFTTRLSEALHTPFEAAIKPKPWRLSPAFIESGHHFAQLMGWRRRALRERGGL